jgi:hypothetical protein
MSQPEPGGTRMQVVKGMSEFCYQFLAPNLPKPRHEMEIHWPRWLGSDWRFLFVLDDSQLAICFLTPQGRFTAYLNTRRSEPAGTLTAELGEANPYELFERLMCDKVSTQLLEHLARQTKKAKGDRDDG